MPELSITSRDFKEGGEIPKECGYKHGNKEPGLDYEFPEDEPHASALIMDDPDAMAAVGKVWVHWLEYSGAFDEYVTNGKNDFGELGYGGPAPPDGRHTYVFKLFDLDSDLDLEKGFTKADLEDAMKGHIISEAKLTGTFAP